MKLSNTIIVSPKYIEEKERQLADLSKKVERLTKLLLKIKPMLSEWDTPMDILVELDELEGVK